MGDKVEVAPGVTVGSLTRVRAALTTPLRGMRALRARCCKCYGCKVAIRGGYRMARG